MCEVCIQNFLNKTDPGYVERHSDSSDFENSSLIPVVTPKTGYHSLLRGKLRSSKKGKSCINNQLISGSIKTFESHQIAKHTTKHQSKVKSDQEKLKNGMNYGLNDLKINQNLDKFPKKEDKRNRGDQNSSCFLERNTSIVKNKIFPCLSTILRRPINNNCLRHLTSINENSSNEMKKNYKLICSHNQQRKTNKNKKQRHNYSIQPVYAIKNIQGFPLSVNPTYDNITSSHYSNLNSKKSDMYHSATSSSTSEQETIKCYNYERLLQKYKKRSQKNLKKPQVKQCSPVKKENILDNKEQQCPSKLRLEIPYQIFTSSYNAKYTSVDSKELGKEDSNSSVFWNFLAEKVHKKYPMQKISPTLLKECDCEKPPLPCSPETCQKFSDTIQNETYYDRPVSPKTSPTAIPKKTSKEDKVECKCFAKKEKTKAKKKLTKMSSSSSSSDSKKPCQERHDNIVKTIGAKYNGEILCIHNPPCILINGCLNLPSPKAPKQDCWTVTQSKKSSFAQMCRKIKRSKHKGCEQGCQYQPPYSELEQCLPEFRTEKIIQSICNHNPPCQIVHGCYKPRYDPNLANSCVHVPMCEKIPECVMGEKEGGTRNNACQHTPKCTEIPICSRKYVVLTAKDSACTQVYPASKMICRHDPPCLRIPKCLAKWMYSDHITQDSHIPGCSHYPRCELIPACCRKCARDMVSVTSQHPAAPCRIV